MPVHPTAVFMFSCSSSPQPQNKVKGLGLEGETSLAAGETKMLWWEGSQRLGRVWIEENVSERIWIVI